MTSVKSRHFNFNQRFITSKQINKYEWKLNCLRSQVVMTE